MAEIVPNRVPCGNNKESQKPAVTSVPVKQIHGITYFKLQSDYPGDYTKNCGLLGSEIDENFFFLRSNDIKTGYTEEIETRKYLVLVKVDDEEIRIDITDNDEYKFRVEDGYITVIFPDGHEEKMGDAEGNPVRFLVEGDNVHIVTDSSLQGDGSYGNPAGVDLAYRTGTYAPADFYADLTCTAVTINDLPAIGYGHAVVTKEDVSRFGALYTWDQAHKIDEALAAEGRGWRLPTKEDWAKLLNWAEVEEEAKNHDTDKSGNFGCIAGNRLKSMEYWDTISDPETKPVDDFGMAIYPVGVCPEDYNTQEPTQYGFTGLYKVTSFWTSSICDRDGEPYVRTFSYGHNDVAQFTENRKKRLSIRLVRDIDGDFDIADYAEILGDYVPVKLTTDGKQLWTSINISAVNYDGFNQNEVTVPEEWKDINTDVPAVAFYEKVESGDSFAYVWIDEYAIPSTAIVETVEEIPEEPDSASPDYIRYEYIIHFDMLTEAKFFYNAWDGKRWHKKVIREGESVILLHEDYETGCDTAATPYVTSANTNHEWRLFVNEFTGLDELIDTLEALKKEFQKEFDEINERIDDLSATTEEFSAATVEEIARLDERIDDEEARAISAETELHERINALELASAETPDSTILASYILREGPDGGQKGVRIDIPRDKYIKSISTGWSGAVIDEITGEFTYDPESGVTEVVRVVYQKSDGKFELVEIDIEYFIEENEFKDGLEVVDHIVKVKIDPASDWFLTVSTSGVSLQGVDAALDNIVLDVIGGEGSSESGYSIDFYEGEWSEISQEECDSHPHTVVDELPDAKTWTGTTYVEVFDGTNHYYYKRVSSTNYIAGSETILDALNALDAALKDESDRAQAAEQALDEKIDAETERALAAEESISGDVTTLSATVESFSASTVAEVERLDQRIDEEASARTAADEVLQEQIDELSASTSGEIERLEQKIDDEIARATAAEESISGDVTTLSATVESFSAATVAELERLDGQDIADGDYTLTVLDGLTLNRKNGTDTIVISFDGDYGEFGE